MSSKSKSMDMSKLSKSLNKNLKSLNKTLDNCLNDKLASNVIIAILGVYAVIVAPNLPMNVAMAFDSLYVRLFVMVCIAVICLYDPIKALLMAIGFVLSIQRLYVLKKQQKNQVNVRPVNSVSNVALPAQVNSVQQVNSAQQVNTLPQVNTVSQLNTVPELSNTIPEVLNNVQTPQISTDNAIDYSQVQNLLEQPSSNQVNNESRTPDEVPVGAMMNDNGMTGLNLPGNIETFYANHENENAPSAANDVLNNAPANVQSNNKRFAQDKESHEHPGVHENNDKQPAFNTMTESLGLIQSNMIPDCYNKSIKTFHDQHDIQGLNKIQGY